MSELVSVCIPCYEMNGKGARYLNQLLQTIQRQTYNNFEVVISDHSQTDELENVVKKFNALDINYVKNINDRGSSSANINNAIDSAKGSIIKVMFQDDFFVNPKALDIVSSSLQDKHWGLCGCVHTDDNNSEFFYRKVPVWQDDIKQGVNTVGGPSVVFFRPTDVRFDKRLLWYMDTDFYYTLYLKYGLPYIEPRPLVCSRYATTSVSSTMITDEVVNRENDIIKNKYNVQA
jgi:glycosyltransferase involved in cell wall biosynthesis